MDNTRGCKWYIYKATVVAAVGGLLFGYDTAVVPMSLASIGIAYTFRAYMLMSFFAFLFVYKLIPETKGKSPEEIQLYWLPVQAAKQLLSIQTKELI